MRAVRVVGLLMMFGCRKKGRRNEERMRAGEGGAKAGRLAASEDTAEAGEPAGCHLPSRGPTEGSLFSGTWGVGCPGGLFPQVEFLKKGAVALGLGAVEVVQEAAAAAHHGKEAAAGGEVFDGLLEVGGKVVDAVGEDGDLDVRGAGVFLVQAVA